MSSNKLKGLHGQACVKVHYFTFQFSGTGASEKVCLKVLAFLHLGGYSFQTQAKLCHEKGYHQCRITSITNRPQSCFMRHVSKKPVIRWVIHVQSDLPIHQRMQIVRVLCDPWTKEEQVDPTVKLQRQHHLTLGLCTLSATLWWDKRYHHGFK